MAKNDVVNPVFIEPSFFTCSASPAKYDYNVESFMKYVATESILTLVQATNYYIFN